MEVAFSTQIHLQHYLYCNRDSLSCLDPFFDTHSWLIHRELDAEIDQLEGRKRQLNQAIEKDKIAIEQLQNEDSLEKFARETFGHKKKNETIFIVEE